MPSRFVKGTMLVGFCGVQLQVSRSQSGFVACDGRALSCFEWSLRLGMSMTFNTNCGVSTSLFPDPLQMSKKYLILVAN